MHSVPDYSKGYTYRELVSRSIAWGHYFLFFNILFAIFAGSAYVYAAPTTGSFVSFVYLLITWLGHMSFLAFVVYLVILFPLAFIGNYRYYRVLAVLVTIIFFIILLVDIKLYLTVRVHLSLMTLGLIFTQLDFNTGLNYNFLFIAIPIVIVCELVFAKLATHSLYQQNLKERLVKMVILGILGLCFVISHGLHIWADAWQYDKITVLRQAFPAHYPMTAKSFLESHGYLDPNRSRQDSVFNVVYPLEPIAYQDRGESFNVLTISLNGISYSTLNEKDTPELLKLKLRSHSFEDHYLPYENVKDNYFALAYGLPTLYRSTLESLQKPPVMIEGFYRSEYLTRLIESDLGKDKTSDHIIGLKEIKIDNALSNVSVLTEALDQIDSWQDNSHYALMLSLNELLVKDNEKDYKRALHLADAAVGKIIRTLEQKELLNKTLVILTSSQGSPFISDNSAYYDRLKEHVPLFILWPNQDNLGVSSTVLSSHYDLAATIGAEILGITNKAATYSLGHDLRSLPKRDYVVSDEDSDIVLVGEQYCAIYTKHGEVLAQSGGREIEANLELEELISAMRDLNRFME